MTSDSFFVLAVSIITLGGVFFYLLRIEALAKKLEERVRDEDLSSPSQTLGDTVAGDVSAPISSLGSAPAPRKSPR